MIAFSYAIDIARPPAEVFAYLADLEHTPEWNWAVESTRKITPGPVAVGSRYRQTRSVPRPAVEVLQVTELQPDGRLEIVGEIASFQARLTYELARTPNGTNMTNTVELQPPALFGVVGRLFAGRIQASVAENLAVLRTVLEEARHGMGRAAESSGSADRGSRDDE